MVKLVVPAAGGSTTDTLARVVADKLSQKWGKSVIVENIAGGAMNIGATAVARAAPDGHTLLVAPPSPLSFNDLLYKDLNYVPTAFVPITLLATIPNVLVVRKDLPVTSLKELIAYGKANPGKLSYALARRRLDRAPDGEPARSPRRHQDGARALSRRAVRAHRRHRRPRRHVLRHAHDLGAAVPRRQGQDPRRRRQQAHRAPLPEVPTISEAGLPGFRSITWFGLVAPPQTPAALADKINHGRGGHPQEQGSQPTSCTVSRSTWVRPSRADAAKFFAEETALWSKVIKEAGITPQ